MQENFKLKILIILLGIIVIYLKRWQCLYIFLNIVYFFLFTSKTVIFICLIILCISYLLFYAYKIFTQRNSNGKFLTSIYQSKFERENNLNRSCPIGFLKEFEEEESKKNTTFEKKVQKISKTPKKYSKKKSVKKHDKKKTPKKQFVHIKRNLRSNDKNFSRKKKGDDEYTSLLL